MGKFGKAMKNPVKLKINGKALSQNSPRLEDKNSTTRQIIGLVVNEVGDLGQEEPDVLFECSQITISYETNNGIDDFIEEVESVVDRKEVNSEHQKLFEIHEEYDGSRPKVLAPRDLKKLIRKDSFRIEELDENGKPFPRKPSHRSECKDGPRPCPYVSCRYHLYLDVTDSGGIRLNYPGKTLEELSYTCALDVADKGSITIEDIGRLLNVTRERARQLIIMARENLSLALGVKDGRAMNQEDWDI